MIDYEYHELLAQNSIRKEYSIQVYDGSTLETVITNTELHADSIDLYLPLCTEESLKYGACESAYIKFTVSASIGTLKGKKLVVRVRPYVEGETIPYLQVGEFYVDSSELSDDRKSRNITAYDMIHTIINSDVSVWYSECGLPLNLKDFRDSFFEYFGIEQVDIDLVNDTLPVTEVALPDTLSGLEVMESICEVNGCFGRINNEGKFAYTFLNSETTQDYGRNYKQGTLIYEDYEVQKVTSLRVFSNNDLEIVVGSDGNEYVIEDNFLLYDKLESQLQEYAENILDVIKETPKYRVLKADTYGDFCVEPGDLISFTSYEGDTLLTFVLQKTITGLQALTDSFDIRGTEYFEWDLTSENSQIRRLWNNTIALQEQVNGARTYVYAQRNNKTYNIGHEEETTIVAIGVATVDNTVPVFLATIPLTMSIDGEVIFRYYIDGVQLMEDEDTIYLTKGKQFVTLSTFMELEKNVTRRFTVTAQTAYRESENRKQDAKIISLKDWIDNQTITVSGNTATFDYDYVEHPVDTTPPGAVIAKNEMRAMVFGSGLSPEEPWSGLLIVSEPQEVWNLVESGFAGAGETLTLPTQTPINITCADNSATWGLIEIGFASAGEITNRVIELHTNSKRRITEDGGVRIIESGETRYTEGE